jgi:hypothetical protein
MLRLRFYLIALLLFTGIALNIERLNYGYVDNIINLASFVYLLAGISVMSIVLMPSRWKIPTSYIIIFWSVIFLAIKLMLINNRPLFGGLYTYLSIVELFILVGLITLTRKVMEDLYNLEKTVADITLADVSNRVKNLDDAIPDINLEFIRSRRYKRPLGLIVVRLKPENVQAYLDDLSKDIIRVMMSRYSMSKLIRVIDKDIRGTDMILEQHKENRIILLLPEADMDATQIVYENIQKIAKTELGSTIDIGSATFPDDAVTFEALVTCAESKSKKNAKNDLSDHDIPAMTPL